MNQDETDLAILHPIGMVCSDSEVRTDSGPLAEGSPHPRAYGSFGKFFREYVKERKALTIEQAVARVTALPCDTFGFAQRGRIQPGYYADLLVIDWPAFRDRAEFTDPCHYCEGIDSVVVNGVLTLNEGRYTGQRGGQILRRQA
jgi:N-acyl-D-amino-acid deacylase